MNVKEAKEIVKRYSHFDQFYRDEKIHSLNTTILLNYGNAKGYLEAIEQFRPTVEALDAVIHELGVPQPGYMAPVANAYNIAKDALEKIKGVFE